MDEFTARARRRSALLTWQHIASLPPSLPVIYCGGFNTQKESTTGRFLLGRSRYSLVYINVAIFLFNENNCSLCLLLSFQTMPTILSMEFQPELNILIFYFYLNGPCPYFSISTIDNVFLRSVVHGRCLELIWYLVFPGTSFLSFSFLVIYLFSFGATCPKIFLRFLILGTRYCVKSSWILGFYIYSNKNHLQKCLFQSKVLLGLQDGTSDSVGLEEMKFAEMISRCCCSIFFKNCKLQQYF